MGGEGEKNGWIDDELVGGLVVLEIEFGCGGDMTGGAVLHQADELPFFWVEIGREVDGHCFFAVGFCVDQLANDLYVGEASACVLAAAYGGLCGSLNQGQEHFVVFFGCC